MVASQATKADGLAFCFAPPTSQREHTAHYIPFRPAAALHTIRMSSVPASSHQDTNTLQIEQSVSEIDPNTAYQCLKTHLEKLTSMDSCSRTVLNKYGTVRTQMESIKDILTLWKTKLDRARPVRRGRMAPIPSQGDGSNSWTLEQHNAFRSANDALWKDIECRPYILKLPESIGSSWTKCRCKAVGASTSTTPTVAGIAAHGTEEEDIMTTKGVEEGPVPESWDDEDLSA